MKRLLFIIILLLGLSSYALAKDVGMVWDANSEESLVGYNVYERYGNLDYYFIGSVPDNHFIRYNLPSGVEYFWVVTAYNEVDESGRSNEVSEYYEEGTSAGSGGCFLSTIVGM